MIFNNKNNLPHLKLFQCFDISSKKLDIFTMVENIQNDNMKKIKSLAFYFEI